MRYHYMFKKIIFSILCAVIIFYITGGCEKREFHEIVAIKTEAVNLEKVMARSVLITGKVIDPGTGISDHGFCWSETGTPVIENNPNIVSLGPVQKPGSFESTLQKLKPGTRYFVTAFAIASEGVVYGTSETFTTKDGRVKLELNEADSIKTNGALLSARIVSVNGDEVVKKGFCWSTEETVNLKQNQGNYETGPGLGALTYRLSGLSIGQRYFIRAYAVTSADSSYYSETKMFTTLQPPSAETLQETSLTTTSAILNGRVIANGSTTTVTFEYKESTAINWITVPASPSTVTGNVFTSVSYSLSGLLPGKTYQFRVKADRGGEISTGNPLTFTSKYLLPIAETLQETSLTTNSATLNGRVIANGSTTTVTFEYKESTAINWITVPASPSTVTGNVFTNVSYNLSGLLPGKTYQFRVKADRGGEISTGNPLTFTTKYLLPIAETLQETSLTTNSATLNGRVIANGSTTTVTFEYKESTAINWITVPASPSTVTGNVFTNVSYNLSGLLPGKTYQFRVKADRGGEISTGNPLTFTTKYLLPIAETLQETSLTTNSATLNGRVIANGSTTTVTFEYKESTAINWITVPASPSTVTGNVFTNVSYNLSGLLPGKTYQFRVKADRGGEISTGNPLTFTSKYVSPIAETLQETNLTTTSATLNGRVNANGLSTTVTFEYKESTAINWITVPASPSTVTGNVFTNVSYNLSGLLPGKTYQFRVKADSGGEISTGNPLTFTTKYLLPIAETLQETSLTTNSATLNGRVIANGSTTTVTFEYKESTAINWITVPASPSTVTGNVFTNVSYNLSGLLPGKTYHFRVKADRGGEISTGNPLTFTTLFAGPSAETLSATNPTTTSATLNGRVNANGLITTVTFEYKDSTAINWITVPASPSTVTGNVFTNVSYNLSGLLPGKTYQFRVKADRGGEISTGNPLTFTSKYLLPIAETLQETSLTTNSATLNGRVIANGSTTTVTFEYKESTAINWITVPASPSTVTGNVFTNVSYNLSGLLPGKTYQFRVKADRGGEISTGNPLTFTTKYLLPIAETLQETSLTTNSATLNGRVIANGSTTTVTFEYKESTAINWITVPASPSIVTGNVFTNVSCNLSGLLPGKTYQFKVKADKGGETTTGNELTFTTKYSSPIAETLLQTSLTTTSATLNGRVNANGLSTTVTFEYRESTATSWISVPASPSTVTGNVFTNVSYSLSGLLPGKTYQFRVKADRGGDISTGNTLTFTAKYLTPIAETLLETNPTTTSATLNGRVNANGLSTNVTFEYRESTATSWISVPASPSTVTGNVFTNVSYSLSGLLPGKTYQFRVKADRGGDISTGNTLTFTTKYLMPIAETLLETSVTNTSATLNGRVNANGESTTVTFEYKDSTATSWISVPASPSTVTGNVFTNVSCNLSGLLAGTTYQFRVKAERGGETNTGNAVNFTTLFSGLSAETLSITNPTTTSATLNGRVNANGLRTTVTFEYKENTATSWISVPASPSTVTGNVFTNVSCNLSGLLAGTTYQFRVKAERGGETSTGNQLTFTTLFLAPSVETRPATNPTSSSVTLNGWVYAKGASINVAFEYRESSETIWQSKPASPSTVTGTELTNVICNLTGLLPGKTYHFRVIAISGGVKTYGDVLSFNTLFLAPSAETRPATNPTSSSATLNGIVNANGATTIVTFEYKENSATNWVSVPALPSEVTGNTFISVICNLTGLLPGKNYVFRVKAQSDGGILPANELSFSTYASLDQILEKYGMVWVQGGTYLMGCTSEQTGCDNDEIPVHQVTLSNFYIGKFELTQNLWEEIMGSNPASFKGLSRPVEQVSWNDVQQFISKLNLRTGLTFRLPTEAEWEFAARGGTKSNKYIYSGGNILNNVGWYTDNSNNSTHPVREKSANELGLYDMAGNVWEWCSDLYGSYSSSPQTNPQGPSSGSTSRVVRGGSWYNNSQNCRISNRESLSQGSRGSTFGFRLVLVP
jgi:formylglycine-generating enzyme required for sulfatase activity